jgi:hypothetical protein
MKKNLFAIVLISLVAVACKDDDPAPTKTQILASITWRLTGGEVDGDEVKVEDCYEDDEINFEEDGTLTWAYGSFRCYDGEPSVLAGTWEFKRNETEFVIEGVTATEFELIELTTDVFRIQRKEEPLATLIFEPVQD